MRILYVEDHEDTAFVIERLFKSLGHEVELAENCAQARAILRTGAVDVLISDLTLPDGDGCDLMRETKATLDIPGIAISGHGREQDLAKSKAAGFCEHLVKPLDFTELVAALERCASALPAPKAV
jgi:CheY-like chemotaxis protein